MFVLVLAGCTGEIVGPSTDQGDSAVETFGISSLDPSSGPASGNTLVRVAGVGFTTATAAAIGENACSTFTFLSSSELLCVTPPGAVGASELTVTEGNQSDGATFTYLDDVADTAPPDTGDPKAEIQSCTLLVGTLTTEEDTSTSELGVAVVVPGRTEATGEGVGIDVELGFGLPGSDTSTWDWGESYYQSDSADADVYSDTLYITSIGIYDYTFRARVDHGDWTECTLDTGALGEITVTQSTEPVPVDYCHLQYPCEMATTAGATSDAIYAWIYQGGSTDAIGAGPGILMDVGIGDAGTDPETDASWEWTSMTYNEDKDGLFAGDIANDEYMGTFLVPATGGTYDYVVRATVDNGLSYTLCDLGGDACNFGGSSDGYDDPGACTVQ